MNNDFMQREEAESYDRAVVSVASVGHMLAPVPCAAVAYSALTESLGFDVILSGVIALVIWIVGIISMELALAEVERGGEYAK